MNNKKDIFQNKSRHLNLELGVGLNVDLDLKFRIRKNHVGKSLWFASKKKFWAFKVLEGNN